METVRPAQPDDRAACEQLLGQALTDLPSMRGGAALVGTAAAADLFTTWSAAGPEGTLLVGEFHGAVVGLAAVSTFIRSGANEPSGRVDCCYVETAARGVGVGSALMDAAVEWCRQKGCADIDAQALPGDRATKQRLEAAGFTARLLTLNRRLS